MVDFSRIPVIDVSAIYTDDRDAQLRLAEAFYSAYSGAGFSYIVNHQVSEELIAQVFAASQRFHELPIATKMAVELNHLHRGYIPINTSTDVNSRFADVKHPNQSESFMVMREDAPDSPSVQAGHYLAGPNQWPELAGFREAVMAYNTAMMSLAQKLIGIIALSLNADAAFTQSFDQATTWLRLLYYPATPGATNLRDLESRGVYGSAPHTDFGCLTLLAQDAVGGLQVQTPEKRWIDVPRLPGSFVVNAGDMLQRWSNGLLKSTPHRVINTSGQARYSCPFFFDPNVTTLVEPLASCISAETPVAYDSINFDEFLRGELTAGYQRHAEEVPGGPSARERR